MEQKKQDLSESLSTAPTINGKSWFSANGKEVATEIAVNASRLLSSFSAF